MASLIPSAPTISGADGSLTVNPVLVNPILEKVRKTTFYYCQKSSEMHQAWVSRHFNKGSIFRRRCQQNSGMLVTEDLRHFRNAHTQSNAIHDLVEPSVARHNAILHCIRHGLPGSGPEQA